MSKVLVKVKVVDKEISKRVLSGPGGKPLTGEVVLEKKEADRLKSIGMVESIEDGTTTGSNSDDVAANSFEAVTKGFTDEVVELGISTLEDLAATTEDVLRNVNGIGEVIAKELIEKAKELTEA